MSGSSLLPARELVESILGAAGSDHAAVVIVDDGSEVEARFARNSLTTNGVRTTRSVTVACFDQRKDGVATGVVSRSGPVDPGELWEVARAAATDAPLAEDAAPLLDDLPQASDFGDAPEVNGPDAIAGILGGLGGAFGRAHSNGIELAGFAEHHVVTTYLGMSTGARLRHVQPTGKLEMVARSNDGSSSAWVGAGTPDLATIDVASFEQELTNRLRWAERKIDLPPGRYDTLLPPDAVADLMISMMLFAASGREARDGRTVFSAPGGATRIGERLSALPFELRSDPAERGLECSPFLVAHASGADVSVFDNGLPVAATNWIENGELRRLVYHRAGAEKAGTEATPLIDNLVLELPGASGSIDEWVSQCDERALLLTCFWYIRELDPVTLLLTGLTRDGVYLVEKGEVVGAVNNFRFNESPVDVLARASACGGTERALGREWNEWFNRTAAPPLRVPDFNMSSVSPAT
jgi:predicted Zn-dependent protease